MEHTSGHLTTGEYKVKLPDGRIQVVSYEADHEGFRPRITYEASPAPHHPVPHHPTPHHPSPHPTPHPTPYLDLTPHTAHPPHPTPHAIPHTMHHKKPYGSHKVKPAIKIPHISLASKYVLTAKPMMLPILPTPLPKMLQHNHDKIN